MLGICADCSVPCSVLQHPTDGAALCTAGLLSPIWTTGQKQSRPVYNTLKQPDIFFPTNDAFFSWADICKNWFSNLGFPSYEFMNYKTAAGRSHSTHKVFHHTEVKSICPWVSWYVALLLKLFVRGLPWGKFWNWESVLRKFHGNLTE